MAERRLSRRKDDLARAVIGMIAAGNGENMDFNRLQSKLAIESRHDLLDCLLAYPLLFSISQENGGSEIVNMTLKVNLCPDYCSESNCHDINCKMFHICKFYILSNMCLSKNNTCIYGHDLETPHNINLLRALLLDDVPYNPLQKLFRLPRNRTKASIPRICKYYNVIVGCSKQDKCACLHICDYYFWGSCKFGRDKCKRDHNILNNEMILKSYGIDTDRNQSDILEDIKNLYDLIDGRQTETTERSRPNDDITRNRGNSFHTYSQRQTQTQTNETGIGSLGSYKHVRALSSSSQESRAQQMQRSDPPSMIDPHNLEAAECLGVVEHQLPLVFPDPDDDSKIVDVQKCSARNGDPVYEKYKRCLTDSEVYPMNSKPRGHCVVINNQKFDKGTKIGNRDGSEKDVDSLKKLFTQLHFLVKVKDNLTAKDIINLVKYYKDLDHSNYDCFVFVILSHGSHGNIYGVDGRQVDIQEIVYSFDSIDCKSLCGKPKLFFFQACQGDRRDCRTRNIQEITQQDKKAGDEISQKLDELGLNRQLEQVDSGSSSARRADIFIAMATSPGYVSWRNTKIGTWFIQAVVYAFKYWAHSQELVILMTKVNNLVHKAKTDFDCNKQSPEWRSSLGKSLYFFPGLTQEVVEPIQPMDQSEKSATVVNPAGSW